VENDIQRAHAPASAHQLLAGKRPDVAGSTGHQRRRHAASLAPARSHWSAFDPRGPGDPGLSASLPHRVV